MTKLYIDGKLQACDNFVVHAHNDVFEYSDGHMIKTRTFTPTYYYLTIDDELAGRYRYHQWGIDEDTGEFYHYLAGMIYS